MNYTSRNDDTESHPDWNQSPQELNSDATTRADLNGIVNIRAHQQQDSSPDIHAQNPISSAVESIEKPPGKAPKGEKAASDRQVSIVSHAGLRTSSGTSSAHPLRSANVFIRVKDVLVKYAQFVGPGFLIAVAYIDPGNYATDVQAGAATQYHHLFIVLMSNLFAIFLQALCIKLGSVTGLNLAENCRKHLPKWLTIILYLFSESAIIATDIAEVIGSAIALNLLFHIPLVAGCAITMVDVLLLLLFYRPDGSMTRLRLFEYFVMGLVFGVMICFCIQLSYVQNTSAGEVFNGYLPSPAIIQNNGIYLSCGILGATVMPHSIFLGSGIVQPRLRHFDETNGLHHTHTSPTTINTTTTTPDPPTKYRPSITAIRSCLTYSIIELATSLFTFALFVNSAILIVSGASLYSPISPSSTPADLFGIHTLLSTNLSSAAGTVFALALLLSGTSAGIVCTMAGQMVSEGMLNWTIAPWMRRLVTRSISITPSIIIAAAVGKSGLNQALTASQVVLSVILPFVTAPLVWFTCRSHIMTVRADADGRRASESGSGGEGEAVNMRNGWVVTVLAVLIWLVLVVMNMALLVLVGLGKA